MSNSKSVFETLNSINVNDKVEKKNNLTYLSWAWAWAEVKKNYPTATYTIYEDVNGMFYHTDGKSAWVKTGVTINDQEHIEYLPVMDYRNNSILLEKITSVDVNKTIQRSLTKAIARHGLGLYVYAGEDLPGGETKTASKKPVAKKPVSKKMTTIELNIGDENWDKVLNYVVANKSKGLKVIGEELKKKYSMTTAVKKEIANAI
ncbi:MAG: DUF1071 domain-containing protein [Aliivibrio sp.]|nr:DUF1071 domain-containing protein [Aliivibrio sp.]